jgi:hypothetical protein
VINIEDGKFWSNKTRSVTNSVNFNAKYKWIKVAHLSKSADPEFVSLYCTPLSFEALEEKKNNYQTDISCNNYDNTLTTD